MDGLLIEIDEIVVETDPENGPLRTEEAVLHPAVDQRAVETYPELLPSSGGVGPVAVPFAGKQQEKAAPGQLDFMGKGGAAEPALAFGDIEKLVFLQHTAALLGEEIAGRVPGGGIRLAGADGLGAHGVDRQAPEPVVLVDNQVFLMDIPLAHDCLTWLGG